MLMASAAPRQAEPGGNQQLFVMSTTSTLRDRRSRLFGLTVAGDFNLNVPLLESFDPVDLVLSLSTHSLLEPERQTSLPLYVSPLRGKDSASIGSLYQEPGGVLFHFPGAGDFRIQVDRIEAYLSEREGLGELRLLGPVFSYFFELRGLITLHASAVTADGDVIAFVSRHGGGKSGLAAGTIRAGASLVTDDLLVLDERDGCWESPPSYPLMRMWPDEAEYFFERCVDLPRVHRGSDKRNVAVGEGGFGKFQETSSPLACIYLATRVEGAGAVEIQPVSRSEALIELVRHSFSPRLVEAAGLQPGRLDRLARLVRSVPVRRLVYPSGFERLEEVAGRILRDAGLPSASSRTPTDRA
jgi:hypothetical protein